MSKMRFSSIFIGFLDGAKVYIILTHNFFCGVWGEKWDKKAKLGINPLFLGVNESFND